jgi:hypothetical protein
MCSKKFNHSKLKSQQNWGDLYNHLLRKRVFTLLIIDAYDIHMSSKNYEEDDYEYILVIILH